MITAAFYATEKVVGLRPAWSAVGAAWTLLAYVALRQATITASEMVTPSSRPMTTRRP
jgi:hypothetical protein